MVTKERRRGFTAEDAKNAEKDRRHRAKNPLLLFSLIVSAFSAVNPLLLLIVPFICVHRAA
jgi:hypothetical protein